VTLTPLVFSNSGSSLSYAPPNPPDIKTSNCALATVGELIMTMMAMIQRIAIAVRNEKVVMVGPPSCDLNELPRFSRRCGPSNLAY
jgi:hypothetical protein